ncbi:MAG: DUF4961 domain-containing protein [Saprospiraceae bacterium]|nr:DUF4961 domain-containing protein [Saprospiraceae bacterium]
MSLGKCNSGNSRGSAFSRFALVFISLTLLLLGSCLEILTVRQPATAMVGDEITIEIDAEVTGADGSTLIFAFLAPRAWNASTSSTASFESTIGNSTMSIIDPDDLEPESMQPWADQITERVGTGGNYGEVEWTVFKADVAIEPPSGTDESNPVTGTITLNTTVGPSNLITQLGYFLGDDLWGYLNDESNATFFFHEECIEIQGASGQAQNLCGPAPRRLVSLETYTFDDILTITFDAREDTTALIGAQKVYACFSAIHSQGVTEVCDLSDQTEMRAVGSDLWELTIWPPSYFDLTGGEEISEILVSFSDEAQTTVVGDVSGNDFQILSKCF